MGYRARPAHRSAGSSRGRRPREDRHTPRKPGKELEDRKAVFAGIVKYVREGGGWVTSIPGAAVVTFEALPSSTLPADLTELGYDVRLADQPDGQSIIAGHIIERLTRTSSGALELATEGSTKPIEIRAHTGSAR